MTTPSGTPDELGPDATPEQEALVRGLLGGLRADDPPMPDHVAARLDAVLAEERRSAASGSASAGSVAGGAALAGAAADDASTGGGAVAPVTVLPQQRRRPDRSTTALQWLVGAAAAVLVVGGVGAVVRGTVTTGSDSAATSAGGSRLLATGTTYTKDGLAEQARTLVTEPATVAANQGGPGAPETDPETDDRSGEPEGPASEGPVTETPATGETPVPGDAGASGTLDLAGCLQQLTGTSGTDPVAVDQATYEGRAAVVIVLASSDAPGSLDVWVVAPTCRLGEEAFLEFQRIDAP